MLKRSIADGKIRALVRGRDLYEGRNRPRDYSETFVQRRASFNWLAMTL